MESLVRSVSAFGAALRRRRRLLDWSQHHLGERINLRQATISAIEAGTGDVKLSTVMEALAALDLELVIRPRSGATDTEFADAS